MVNGEWPSNAHVISVKEGTFKLILLVCCTQGSGRLSVDLQSSSLKGDVATFYMLEQRQGGHHFQSSFLQVLVSGCKWRTDEDVISGGF